MPYIGVSPQFGVRKKHTYTATAGQTSFSGAGSEGVTLSYTDSNFVDVYQNGVKLGDADYTSTSGTAIVLAQGASVDDLVEIIVFDAFSAADTVSKADGGTFDGIISTSSAGTNNLRIGANAGDAIASGGNYNVVLGDEAGTAITTGDNNVAVGYNALATNTTASTNTAVGYQAAYSNQTGVGITAFGANALYATTASDNCGIGTDNPGNYAAALESNTTGRFNTAVATGALGSCTEGDNNTAVGHGAAGSVTTADACTAVGQNALSTNTTSSYNTAVGHDALALATGTYNTAIGPRNSGDTITTGTKNTIIGDFNGNQDGLDIRTTNKNIILSDGDGSPRQFTNGTNGVTTWSTNISDSDRALSTASHTIHSDLGGNIALFIENSSATPYGLMIDLSDAAPDNNSNYFFKCEDSSAERLFIYSDGDIYNHDGTYAAISDERIKDNITDANSQWDDIKAMRFVNYQRKDDIRQYGESEAKVQLGLIGQELEAISPNLVRSVDPSAGDIISSSEFGSLYVEGDDIPEDKKVGDVKEVKDKVKGVAYSILYMKAVKALQEAMARIETLEAKVTALENAE